MARCLDCALFKLRWRTGLGMCWHQHETVYAEQPACEAFTMAVILVDTRRERDGLSGISRKEVATRR